MTKPVGLRFGPLVRERTVYLCVDMQRLFLETEWRAPWMEKVRGSAAALCGVNSAQTVFTRFIPADDVENSSGAWRRYYERWPQMTLARLDRAMLDLLPELADMVPPAQVFDKRVYSPWFDGELHKYLRHRRVDTLVVFGGETDVCVLATVLGAIDYGYRTIVVEDALCSSSDEAHDASMALFQERYAQQIECSSVAELHGQACR